MEPNKLYKNKIIPAIFMVFGIFGLLIMAHRLSYYVFEYDPQFSPVDYGKYNILSYFTVQSNFLGYVYLIIASLGCFGVQKVRKFAFNPMFGALATTYIFIAGLVFCCGIPLGFTPPFKWDTAVHSMSSFTQIYYHMIMPVLVLLFWNYPIINEKIPMKKAWLFGIYPLVYSIFSIIRGAFSNPTYYPYPFYNPIFFWEMFFKDKPINLPLAYLLIVPVLIVGIMFFIGIAAVIIKWHNKQIENKKQGESE